MSAGSEELNHQHPWLLDHNSSIHVASLSLSDAVSLTFIMASGSGPVGPVLARPLLQRVSIILRQTKCQ